MKVRWWPHTTNRSVASVRIRTLAVIDALRAQHIDADLYHSADAPRVLILAKRYDQASLQTALALRGRHGTKVVLDLCDNHFYAEQAGAPWDERRRTLVNAVENVDLVVVASVALGDIVRSECSRSIRISVIPDAVELPSFPTLPARFCSPLAELGLFRLSRALEQSGTLIPRRLVWFGNHGSPGVNGGMDDLRAIAADLRQAGARNAISLTVISNSERRFREVTRGWTIPAFYLPWHPGTFSRALQLHSSSVLPITLNPFTICKTNNRLATSILHGLSVVGDRIPSYDEFTDCTVLGDWSLGLGAYLDDDERRRLDIAIARSRLDSRYTGKAIAAEWSRVLRALVEDGSTR